MGLALSGGMLKAAAHVGVLAALHELGVEPQAVAGTSAGSFVAALYAHGCSPQEMQQLVRRFPGARLFDYGFPLARSALRLIHSRLTPWRHRLAPPLPGGLMRGRRLTRYFRDALAGRQAERPYYLVATDLLTGRPVVFSNDRDAQVRGLAHPVPDLALAVAGSCAVPGVLTPVELKPWLLVDGALRHYVPVDVLRQAGCSHIIAVNLYRLDPAWEPHTFVHVLARSFEILLQESIDNEVEGGDLFVLEPEVRHMTWVSFGELARCVSAGSDSVTRRQAELRRFLARPPVLHARPLVVSESRRQPPGRM
ncbi:MAG: patatin-like phospholipase family protein [Alicyclobacillaceae bacterium]|nr:patatin-like phospholipase family protein [Alicyclobacillaceae bacterium]